MDQCNLFDKYQVSSRQGYSTQTAPFHMINDIRRAVDDRLITIVVYYDFKALDPVDHGLLVKLARLGCSRSILQWFRSYLTDRTQTALEHDNTTSTFGYVLSSVPQGSIF